MSKRQLLISSGGTGSAFATAEAAFLNFNDKVDLTICDINPKELVSSSVFATNFFVSKPIHHVMYKEFVVDLINSQQIDICIPFIDKDIQIFAELSNEMQFNRQVSLQVNRPEIARICADKMMTYDWLIANDIFTPHTYQVKDFQIKSGFIIKPKGGFASKIKQLNRDNVLAIINSEEYIIQEECSSPEVTIDVYRNTSKDIFFYLCRERIETKSGVCTKARLFLNENLGKLALKLADSLGLKFFCFQVMKLRGDWAVTDVNPRFGSGTPMSSVVGIDFFSAMIADFLDEDSMPYLNHLEKEVLVTRQYRNILSS